MVLKQTLESIGCEKRPKKTSLFPSCAKHIDLKSIKLNSEQCDERLNHNINPPKEMQHTPTEKRVHMSQERREILPYCRLNNRAR